MHALKWPINSARIVQSWDALLLGDGAGLTHVPFDLNSELRVRADIIGHARNNM